MKYRKLIEAAEKAKRFSLAPYSEFRVGAALLARDGKIISGCNIENSSFSLTVCAERTALFKAISDGKRKFSAMAIVSDAGEFTPPCGACRQVIKDLAGDIDIILANRKGETKIVKLADLLPLPFNDKYLR